MAKSFKDVQADGATRMDPSQDRLVRDGDAVAFYPSDDRGLRASGEPSNRTWQHPDGGFGWEQFR